MSNLLMFEMLRKPEIKLDPEDYEKLKFRSVSYVGGYLAVTVGKDGRNPELLHRLILGDPPYRVDHKNRNKLDLRKENLRPCTQSQNCANTGLSINNTSGYKGVTWNKANRNWLAQIMVNRRNHYIGSYKTPELAAAAYNRKALEFFGEFANLNTLPEVLQTA